MFDLSQHKEIIKKLSFNSDELLYDYILRIGSEIMEDNTFAHLVLDAAKKSKSENEGGSNEI